jgi:hypothetical protein
MLAKEQAGANVRPPQGARISCCAVLRSAIDALVSNDTEQLHRLLQSLDSSASVTPLPQDEDLAEALSLHRLLGALLMKTQRNLRLLRRAAGVRTPRSYGSIDF